MSVTVSPETFTFVQYEHAEVQRIANEAARDAGIPDDAAIEVEIVESSPLGRVTVEDADAGPPPRAKFRIEGGAFENLRAPRELAPERVRETLGRLFFRLHDSFDPDFGFEGDPDALPVPRQVAWDVYALGRLRKKGYEISHDRWLYLWRNRHGFSDESDLAFERLWSAEPITWPEILSTSEQLKPDSELQAPRRTPARQK